MKLNFEFHVPAIGARQALYRSINGRTELILVRDARTGEVDPWVRFVRTDEGPWEARPRLMPREERP